MRARQKLTKAFRLFVFMCCTVFTGFQTYKCLEKYQSTPRGTSMILTSPSKLQDFPAITLCPKLKGFGGKSKDCTVFNGTKLKECDIFIELPKGNRRGCDAYSKGSMWAPQSKQPEDNKSCSDPKALFESIVAKPSDLIHKVTYHFMEDSNGETKTEVYPDEHEMIFANDHAKHGRCFTTVPTLEIIKKRIEKINLYPKILDNGDTPSILFHMPRTFASVSYETGRPMFYKTTADKREDYILEYQVHKKLNLGSIQPCEDGMGYSYDLCAHGAIHNETMAKSGCTTPFGPDKNHICTNLTVANQVFQMFLKSWKKQKTGCKVPCKLYNVRLMKVSETPNPLGRKNGYTQVTLEVKGQVAVTEEVFLYTALSMVAEVGGYVGLFLGVSVNQVAALFEFFLDRRSK